MSIGQTAKIYHMTAERSNCINKKHAMKGSDPVGCRTLLKGQHDPNPFQSSKTYKI